MMTKVEFIDKWTDDHHSRDLKRAIKHDLGEVIKEYTNPLVAGITNAIFELEQAYKDAGKKGAKK